jgi:hypothetical protein
VRRAVTYGAAGNMTVLDCYNGMLMVVASEVMDNDLAVAAELACKTLGYMSGKLKSFIRLHMMLPLSYDALNNIDNFSNKNFFTQ